MNRRHLLTMIPAASALFAMRSYGKPVPQEALNAAGFTVSVQCWSFNKFTLFEAIEKSAAAGAAAVEIFPGQKLGGPHGDLKLGPELADDVIQSLQEHLKKNNIVAVNFGVTDINANIDKARPTFEFAKKLGLYGITTESIGSIDTIEKLAKEYDVNVGFHNHPKRPGYKMWDPDFVYNSVKDRDKRVGICADIGHWASSGLDPLEVIKKVADRVRSFHFKDREKITEWTHDRPYGTGIIKLPEILDEVRKHGFAGNVTIEYEHNWDKSLPEIAQCVGYLRAYSKLRPGKA